MPARPIFHNPKEIIGGKSTMISNQFNSPKAIMKQFDKAVNTVVQNIEQYASNPTRDFTRKRKQPVNELIKFMVLKQAKSVDPELSEYYTQLPKPTPSAFTQQRAKLKPEALYRIFQLLTSKAECVKTYRGYRILAADGSDVNIPLNPSDIETYRPPQGLSVKGFNQFHVNALYDVLSGIYVDLNIDTAAKPRECEALCELFKCRGYDQNSVVICDRGYENYELIAQFIENKQPFIIRVKDIRSNGILSPLELPDEEFDMPITKILTRRQSNEFKNNRKYTFLPKKAVFSYLVNGNDTYKLSFRAVRFKITDDTYECLITNLSEKEFPITAMKELYHMRWGIEVGFRQLKYNISLIYFHGKSQMFCRQEIYARFIMFNLSKMIINTINQNKEESTVTTMYEYKSRFDSAVTNIRLYLKKLITEEELIVRIKKALVPIVPERSFIRKMRTQTVKSSHYRAC